MAYLNVEVNQGVIVGGCRFNVYARVTYSLTSGKTSDVFHVQQVYVYGTKTVIGTSTIDSWSLSGSASVSFAGTSLGTFSANSAKTVDKTITVSKTHATQTKTVSATFTGKLTYYQGTEIGSVSISGSSGTASVTVDPKAHYTVYFYLNGGTGGPDTQTKWHGETLTLSSTKPTRDDYVFNCWVTADNTTYSPGGSYTANSSISLYARWNPKVYYQKNTTDTVKNLPSTQTKVYNTTLTLSSSKPTRSGYSFWHWNTATGNNGTTYEAGGSYAGNTTLTLYAIWNPLVIYDANGGVGGPATEVKTYGQSYVVSSTVPTRTGYTFSKWTTKADGTGTSYSPGGTISSTNMTVYLYAQWTKDAESPTISSVTSVRCDSAGDADDEGTYCKLTVAWGVDTANVSGNRGTVTATISPKPSGASSTAVAFDSGASGTSGTAVALIAGCSADTQYTIKVTVTDSGSRTSTRTDILTRAKFVWDIRKGGEAMGVGSAAPAKGLEVGWDAQFDGTLKALGDVTVGTSGDNADMTVNGDVSAHNLKLRSFSGADVAAGENNWTVTSAAARKWGPVAMVSVTVQPPEATSASENVAQLDELLRPALVQRCQQSDGGWATVQTSGLILLHPASTLSATSTVAVALTYLCASDAWE